MALTPSAVGGKYSKAAIPHLALREHLPRMMGLCYVCMFVALGVGCSSRELLAGLRSASGAAVGRLGSGRVVYSTLPERDISASWTLRGRDQTEARRGSSLVRWHRLAHSQRNTVE